MFGVRISSSTKCSNWPPKAQADTPTAPDPTRSLKVATLPFPATVSVQVVTNCDMPTQQASNITTVATHGAAPEFFYSAQAASGSNPIAAFDGLTWGGVGDPARLGSGFHSLTLVNLWSSLLRGSG